MENVYLCVTYNHLRKPHWYMLGATGLKWCSSDQVVKSQAAPKWNNLEDKGNWRASSFSLMLYCSQYTYWYRQFPTAEHTILYFLKEESLSHKDTVINSQVMKWVSIQLSKTDRRKPTHSGAHQKQHASPRCHK